MDIKDDKSLSLKLLKGDKFAFEQIFRKYYQSLCFYASFLLGDEVLAEEVVQEIFTRIWEKKSSVKVEVSLKNYLFHSVRNHCLNQLQHNKIKQQYAKSVLENKKAETSFDKFFLEPDLKKRIDAAIQSLPEKRKQIFLLSREDGLKYKEIAEKLNVSVKTVETQMGFALKHLRSELADYKDYFNTLIVLLQKK